MREFAKKYHELLTGEFGGINLTRILEFEEFYQKQILDSVSAWTNGSDLSVNLLEKKLLVDVGFGGGFPLLPLAYCFPDCCFVGLEARNKKVSVVNQIAEKLNLENVRCFHHRLENIFFDEKCFVTLKAVGRSKDFLKLIQAGKELSVVFYKGPQFDQNPDEGEIKGWKEVARIDYRIEGAEKRFLVEFSNTSTVEKRNLKKDLVNLSSLVSF